MKQLFGKAFLALALALALILGVVALAENVEAEGAEPELPAAEEAEAADSAALEDALDAYYAARDSGRADALEAELKEYVAAGKMTQEQADLILDYCEEQQALRDGVCPNCGYEFQFGGGRGGKGGRMNGGRGGMHGMRQSFGADDADLGMGMLENPYRANLT